MRKLLLVALIAASCRTATDAVPAQPRFRVRQPSGQILPNSYSPTATLDLLVDIYNETSEPITLKQLQLQSVIGGGYRFQSVSKIFNKEIPPRSVEAFDIVVVASQESLDVNSPVRVRGTAIFDSPAGSFRRVFTTEIIESSASPHQ